MTVSDILNEVPGSRIFMICDRKDQESMVEALCMTAAASFRHRTMLNTCSVAMMDISPDENPNHFSDLQSLCVKLICAAGKRSHFEGLLILNLSALAESKDQDARMKALGEFLAMKEGLASKCTTLLYGPSEEKAVLFCTEQLDFDGKLRVGCYEPVSRPSLSEILNKASLRCETPETEVMLSSAIDRMLQCSGFSADRFVYACSDDQGQITEYAVSRMLQDPYSYINRMKKATEFRCEKSGCRKIGFR